MGDEQNKIDKTIKMGLAFYLKNSSHANLYSARVESFGLRQRQALRPC